MDVQRTLEHDLELLCLTGVEDKLQVFTARQDRIAWPITHILYCVAQPRSEHFSLLTELTALKNIFMSLIEYRVEAVRRSGQGAGFVIF